MRKEVNSENRHNALPISIEDHILSSRSERSAAEDSTKRPLTENTRLEHLKNEYYYHTRQAQEIFEEILQLSHHDLQSKPCTITEVSPSTEMKSHINNNDPLKENRNHNTYSTLPIDVRLIERTFNVGDVKNYPKALSRKPRDLCFNPSGQMFVATSLDGGIFHWEASKRRIKSVSYLTSFLHRICHVETCSWLDEETLLLVSEGNNEGPKSNISTLRANEFQHLLSPERCITSLHCWYPDQVLLGSLEKSVDILHCSTNQLEAVHTRHSSAVHAVYGQQGKNIVFSGGADCRLVAFDTIKQTCFYDTRWEARISHIQPLSHTNSSLLLVTFCCSEGNQLRLFDQRTEKFEYMFGWKEASNISRYLRPSISSGPDCVIACGTSVPLDKSIKPGSFLVWDQRSLNGPLCTIDLGTERRFLRTEFRPHISEIVAMSTDGALSFVDYSIAS